MRLILVSLLSLASAAALAQPPSDTPAAVNGEFYSRDRNRDGYVSRMEAAGDREIAKRFSAFDVDNDGRLSESEYTLAKDDNDKRAVRDTVLTARVKAALLAERGVPSMSISVETYEGRVQLSGFVNSPEIVSRAGRVTATVSGVRTVHNNIAVK
jgi:hyperosmotically inducible protein